jgi:L-2,4-diaminobutyric acid acetyltransferase
MTSKITFHTPSKEDGFSVSKLIESCPPLDTNSVYCNLLQCHHFAQTSVAAKIGEDLVGFVSGYLIPEKPETLFIWQVAVAEKARGQGLARQMVQEIIDRPENAHVTWVETTITDDNKASWALFESLARHRGGMVKRSSLFDKAQHFSDEHDTEYLARVGPLTPKTNSDIIK